MKMSKNVQLSSGYTMKPLNGLPLKLFLVYLVITPFIFTITNAQNFYENKKSDQNRPFYMGSRYGRSGQQGAVQVTPRTDRFFMGSRYGKRALGMDLGEVYNSYSAPDDFQDEHPQKTLDLKNDAIFEDAMSFDPVHPHHNRALRCAHLGIANIYRCYSRDMDPSIAL